VARAAEPDCDEASVGSELNDVYRRTLAVCRIGDEDLNAWMVREGFALAFVKYSEAYANEEAEARKAQRGLWSGAFIA
jgi:endonuclease YncB( thermonuclease family)